MPRRIARVRVNKREQSFAVATAYHSLQRGQIFVESAEHLQHGVLVMQEDVPPHRRVGGGDPSEIAKSAGRELDHLRAGDLLEIGRRANNIIGDEMRHMAGDREHQVVVGRAHHLDMRSQRFPERPDFLHRLFVRPLGRGQNAPSIHEQARKPGVRA